MKMISHSAITGSAPTFWTKGYPLEMECTARAENNVEIKFVRRTEDEDIDVNEVTEQTEYNSKTMSRKGSLIIDSRYFIAYNRVFCPASLCIWIVLIPCPFS